MIKRFDFFLIHYFEFLTLSFDRKKEFFFQPAYTIFLLMIVLLLIAIKNLRNKAVNIKKSCKLCLLFKNSIVMSILK